MDEEPGELHPIRFGTLDEPIMPDSGYLPPRDDQSWREMEALRFVAVRDEDDADGVVDPDDEPVGPDQEYRSTGHGAGGVMLFLSAVVGVAIVALLASPNLLTADFWRAHWAALTAKPVDAPVRVANIPAPVPAALPLRPPVQSLPTPAASPALHPSLSAPPPANAEHAANAEPPAAPAANAMPPANSAPQPDARPSGRDDRDTMVIAPDGSVKYEKAPFGSKPAPAARAFAHDDRGAGGFYAMVPGLDGVLRREYFPSGPQTGSRPAVPDDRGTGDRGTGGFYAMVAGPDGTLRYRYFPSSSSR